MHAPLLPVEDALSQMLNSIEPLTDCEAVTLSDARGRVLSEDQFAACQVPPADNSAMDGYALNLADLGAPLPVSQRIVAGQAAAPLRPGTCARIFTGAEIPLGANAVVMQEQIQFTAFGDIVFPQEVLPGQNIRPAGQDIRSGQCLLRAGTRLDARHLGLLASCGIADVAVRRRVRVALLATGDELVAPGRALAPGQIYNSNAPLLAGLLQEWGAEVRVLDAVADTLPATLQALREAADNADLILSTGGVSVGEEDHIKPALEQLGQLQIWRLAMKPGKPLAVGRIGSVPFIGLPGNPVSTFVGAQIFVRPALLKLGGEADERRWFHGRARFEARTQIRQEYLRVQASWHEDGWQLQAFENQNSGVLTSVIWGNALAIIPPQTQVAEGDQLRFQFFAPPLSDYAQS